MVPLFNAALNKRVAAKLWKQPLTMRASKSGMSAYETLVQSADQANKLPGQLSGGQQQRVAIAPGAMYATAPDAV